MQAAITNAMYSQRTNIYYQKNYNFVHSYLIDTSLDSYMYTYYAYMYIAHIYTYVILLVNHSLPSNWCQWLPTKTISS